MYCKNCGAQIDDRAVVCPKCGVPVKNTALDDAPNAGFFVLGLIIPLAGLILFIALNSKSPLKAKSAGKGALIGFIARIVLYILAVFLFFLLIYAIFGGYAIPILF